MTYIDLVMDNGEITRIEVPDKHADACWKAIEQAMKTRGWLSLARWAGCQATYMGMMIDRVNLGRMVATL